jgi:hypothetical protein
MTLEDQHEVQRIKALKALEALCAVRRHAILQLQKTQILFKYLHWKQQEHINSKCERDFSLQKMFAVSVSALNNLDFAVNSAIPAIAEHGAAATDSSRGFTGVSQVQKVKTARKNIVQFGIIQARADELIEAIAKSVAVFNHQYKTACRELFPLGFISKLRRHIRRFLHHPYYDWQEIGCLQNLGVAAGLIFKMAETPVLGARR